MESDKIKLTGLWKNKSKSGETYLTGRISPTSKLLILPNTFKKTDKDPDFMAYLTPVREEDPARTAPDQESFL